MDQRELAEPHEKCIPGHRRLLSDASDTIDRQGWELDKLRAGSLDAAWEEAESAQKGWWVELRGPNPVRGYRAVPGAAGVGRFQVWGPTPAAALRALAVVLREAGR